MTHLEPPDWARLAAYVAGELDVVGRGEVEAWIAQSPGADRQLETVRFALQPRQAVEAEQSFAATAWDRFRLRWSEEQGKPEVPVGGRGREVLPLGRQTLRRGICAKQALWKVPVGIVSALILWGATTFMIGSRYSTHASILSPTHIYRAAPGRHAVVTLPEGSHMLLGPATTVWVTERSKNRSLDIYVLGQARFAVAHNVARPFRVRTGRAVAEVLGTTFFVRQYETDSIARIVVTEGRIALSSVSGAVTITPSRVLTAGVLGMVNDSGVVQVIPNAPVDEFTSWTTDQLIFRQTPVRNAVLELGRAYNVKLRVMDSVVAASPLTWRVNIAHRSLADVLEVLSGVLNVHAVQTGRVITLVPGQPSVRRDANPRSFHSQESQYGR